MGLNRRLRQVGVGGTLLLWLALAQASPMPTLAKVTWIPVFTAPLKAPSSFDAAESDAALRFNDVSLLQFVPLSVPGLPPRGRLRLRIKLSNEYGDGPLVIYRSQVAWRADRAGVAVQSSGRRALRFEGKFAVQIPVGATALSDPFDMVALRPNAAHLPDLAIGLYLAERSPRVSWHPVASRSSYRSPPGDHLATRPYPVAKTERSVYFISAIEAAWRPSLPPVWVAFGDSITDGAGHLVDADNSWPLRWRQAWAHRVGRPSVILNAGQSGNRLLTPLDGPSGRTRFERDVLALRGVTGVVLQIGINDLGSVATDRGPSASAAEVIAGQADLLHRARARGIKVVGATLTPITGSMHDRDGVEPARQLVNAWIRRQAGFDAVIDFDAVVSDPAQPGHFRPGWTDDLLHPNDTAYAAMAAALVRVLDQSGLAPVKRQPR